MKMKIKAVIVLLLAGGTFYLTYRLSKPAATSQPATAAASAPAVPPAIEPPLLVSGSPGGSSEAALRQKERQLEELVRDLQGRIAECRRREEELAQREKRIAAAQDMLKTQAQELENLRIQLVAPLARLKEAKSELQQSQILVAQQEKENLKKTALIYEKMDAASGCRILEAMCANRQEADAVKILHYMSDRAAAKLLSEITDKQLAANLTEKMKQFKEQS